MITDVTIVYNNKDQISNLGDTLKVSPFFTFIDESSRKGRKEAYALKSHWGARLTPFVVCYNKDNAIKVFYSETGEDVIKSLIDYLNEYEQDIHS